MYPPPDELIKESGKMQLLERMLNKLHAEGHKARTAMTESQHVRISPCDTDDTPLRRLELYRDNRLFVSCIAVTSGKRLRNVGRLLKDC